MSGHCSLCGGPIGAVSHCAVCPLAGACHVQCCPRCGYQTVDEEHSIAARLIRRLFGTRAATRATPQMQAPAHRTLADLRPGDEAEVRGLGDMPEARLIRLTALGLTPGDRVRLVQRGPVPVIRIDETEVALGSEILSQIQVVSAAPPPSRLVMYDG